jgi:hypothetical protein
MEAYRLLDSVNGIPMKNVNGIGARSGPTAPPHGLVVRLVAIALLLGVSVGGSYASHFFTRKINLQGTK